MILLKAALNGNRAPSEHPALPVSPAQLALEARGAVAAGAAAIHLHVRDASGRESLAPADLAATLQAVRASIPGVPVGVSTGAWIEPDLNRRLALLAAWDTQPDFASVNLHEDGALEVAELLLSHGVGVEAGLANPAAAELLIASGLAERCLRVLIEPTEPDLTAARANVAGIESALDRAAIGCQRLLHGENATAWPLLADAIARGYATRIGLEDVLALPDGARAPDNASLVAAARQIIAAAGA
jgi:uncharacterized protein (DUF849 family)